MFQRRHYELIARAIREMDLSGYDSPEDRVRGDIAGQMAKALRLTNPNFQEIKFLEACSRNTTYKEKSRA